ncbi:MAG: RDD family protein [Chloroflexi bacterium]|nr:RDD family protein [Chloroflexota bacterium]
MQIEAVLCRGCGQPHLTGSQFCRMCGRALVLGAADKLAIEKDLYAGFWFRLGAYLIDYGVLFLANLPLAIFLAVVLGPSNLENLPVWAHVISLGISYLYYAGMESSARQATFGKSALGVKVTGLHGNRISFWRDSVRFFARIPSMLLLFTGFLAIAFTAKKQGLHDKIAGCLVVMK